MRAIILLLAGLVCGATASGADLEPRYFDTNDAGVDTSTLPKIAPWRAVKLDPSFGGSWVVAGDLDGDGAVEIVSAENFNEDDVHYTSAAAAQKLDGTPLWTWGDPDSGRKELHHDVALQIHDWDGDGKPEVVLLTKNALVELNGATGEEKRRIAIPGELTDSLVFCDLTGNGRRSDVLVKDRYHRIMAFNQEGEQLWDVTDPGGYRTAHQPRPMDIDGDGIDEIMAGYALLNADGTVRWVFDSDAVDLNRGHLDCARILKRDATPEETQIVLTCCGANNLAVVTGAGKTVWEVSGDHYESVNVGLVFADHPGPQIFVDVDHRPQGESPIRVFDAEGNLLGEMIGDYCRQHKLIDWDGDGNDEYVVAHSNGLYDETGTRIAVFDMPGHGSKAFPGDMDGDNVPDLLFEQGGSVYIFRNESGKKADEKHPLGTGENATLY